MTTFPSVCGVWTLIIATAKPVMLQVVDEFKEVNRHGRLAEVGHQVGPTKHAEADEEGRFKHQRATGVHRSSPVGPLHLPRDGLQNVGINASPPGR